MMRHHTCWLCLLLLIGVSACEGLFTGSRESVHSLTESSDGGYTAVRLTLDPEWNPIAFNLKGATVATPLESGRWNSYRAILVASGAPIATGRFDVNNGGTAHHEEGGDFAITMLFASVPTRGEYELRIEPAKPKEITIQSPRVEVRRNTQPPPR